MNKNIRVLYKKTGQPPQIKFIKDMLPIKKLIISGDLELVKFENCIIVCNNRKKNKNKIPNIVLDFKNIAGDFFLIDYDAKQKDFKSLSVDKAIFYTDTLQRKSFQYDKYLNWLAKTSNNDMKGIQTFQKDLSKKENREFGSKQNTTTPLSQFNDKAIEMILNIQAMIFKYIKNMNGEQ